MGIGGGRRGKRGLVNIVNCIGMIQKFAPTKNQAAFHLAIFFCSCTHLSGGLVFIGTDESKVGVFNLGIHSNIVVAGFFGDFPFVGCCDIIENPWLL